MFILPVKVINFALPVGHQWFSTNFNVEVHAYVKNGKFCVVNNTYEPQNTVRCV